MVLVMTERYADETRIVLMADISDASPSSPDPVSVYLDVDEVIDLMACLQNAVDEVARDEQRRKGLLR